MNDRSLSPVNDVPIKGFNEPVSSYNIEKFVPFKSSMNSRKEGSRHSSNASNPHPRFEENKSIQSDNHKENSRPNVVSCKRCDICNMEILPNLVFVSNVCKHQFCLYCLEEASLTTDICILKTCPNRINLDEVKKFCNQKGYGESSSQAVENPEDRLKKFSKQNTT